MRKGRETGDKRRENAFTCGLRPSLVIYHLPVVYMPNHSLYMICRHGKHNNIRHLALSRGQPHTVSPLPSPPDLYTCFLRRNRSIEPTPTDELVGGLRLGKAPSRDHEGETECRCFLSPCRYTLQICNRFARVFSRNATQQACTTFTLPIVPLPAYPALPSATQFQLSE